MKLNVRSVIVGMLALLTSLNLYAQSSAFTYQGQLLDGSTAANGLYDMQFSLFDAVTNGVEQSAPVEEPVLVTNGLFTVLLDFGSGVFDGNDRWIEIGVRSNGYAGAFSVLSPRQQVTSIPFAVSAGSLDGRVSSSFSDAAHTHDASEVISGTLDSSRLNIGTAGGTIAAGDHGHDSRYYSQSDVDALVADLQTKIDNLESTAYAGLPPPPEGLAAVPLSTSTIALSWSYYDQVQEDGFNVERSIGESGSYLSVAALPPDSTSFIDTPLISGTGYTYRVSAYNALGSSGYSTASAMTYPPGSNFCNGLIDVLAADPPIVHNIAAMQIQIFAHGLSITNPAAEVALIAGGLSEIIVPFSISSPNVLVAEIPFGLSTGAWDIRVAALNGDCGTLIDGVQIIDNLSVTVDAAGPEYVSAFTSTPMTITGAGFSYGARMFSVPSSGGMAVQLESAGIEGSDLHGDIPDGLVSGGHDLLVINLDGSAGVLPNAFTVLTNGLPVIHDVSQSYFAISSGQSLTISGEGFVSPVQATLLCQDPYGGGAEIPLTVSSSSSTSLVVQFDASIVEDDSVCVVTVQNPDGGTAESYAVTASSPALTANAWSFVSELNQSRRKPAVAEAVLPDGSGILYAIGGDDGNVTSSFTSVESIAVGGLGQPGVWRFEQSPLPEGRTFAASVKAGPFIYVTGGYVGGGSTSSVIRAAVLDELSVPDISSAVISYDAGVSPGISAGAFDYRISAIYLSEDPVNPDGESLAGGNRQIVVPSLSNIAVDLSWSAVPGASGYRVYKTDGSGAYELLAEVSTTTTSFRDDGGISPDPGQTILPKGSLGKWHPAPSMLSERAGHASAVAPIADQPGQYAIYVIGGNDAAGVRHTSIEAMFVDEDGQVIQSWTNLSVSLSSARSDIGAWMMRSPDSPQVPGGEYWLYIGPGSGDSGFVSTVEGSKVLPNGNLQAPAITDSVGGVWTGYATFVEKNKLYIAGGYNGASSSTKGASPTGVFPDLANWNALGVSLNQARQHSGYGRMNGSLFIIGGSDSGGSPLSSVERAIK